MQTLSPAVAQAMGVIDSTDERNASGDRLSVSGDGESVSGLSRSGLSALELVCKLAEEATAAALTIGVSQSHPPASNANVPLASPFFPSPSALGATLRYMGGFRVSQEPMGDAKTIRNQHHCGFRTHLMLLHDVAAMPCDRKG